MTLTSGNGYARRSLTRGAVRWLSSNCWNRRGNGDGKIQRRVGVTGDFWSWKRCCSNSWDVRSAWEAVAFVVVLMFGVSIGTTVSVPIKQRNEAQEALDEINRKSEEAEEKKRLREGYGPYRATLPYSTSLRSSTSLRDFSSTARPGPRYVAVSSWEGLHTAG
jgi:hypothetical protein